MRTDGVIFPRARLTHGWACPVCTRRHSHAHGGRAVEGGTARLAVPSEGAALSSQRNKSRFLLGKTLQTPMSQTPKTESKDQHLNKPKSGGKHGKKYFGSDKQILDFDVSCLLFGFPLEERCVRRPWLASWQGSLQVCFLYFFKKTFWIST